MKRWQEYFILTRREYFADFFITPPITLALATISVIKSPSLMWPVKFAIGAAVWTLYEYALHRWFLHHFWGARELHGLHHDDQRAYVATHPIVTLAIYGAGWLLLGFDQGAFAAGFACAYVVYSALHTAFHYVAIPPGHWLFALKRHHALHHVVHDRNFGVSTTLWDRAFGTLRT